MYLNRMFLMLLFVAGFSMNLQASVMGDLKGFFYVNNSISGQTNVCYTYTNSFFPSTKVLNKKRYYKGTDISVSSNSKDSLMPMLDGEDLLRIEQSLFALDLELSSAKELIQANCSLMGIVAEESASLEDKKIKVYSNSCSEDSMPNASSKEIKMALTYSQIVKDLCGF